MKWELQQRPPEGVCPEEFCFHWGAAGDKASPPGHTYASVREALLDSVNWPEWPAGGCGCHFGPCRRSRVDAGATDYYEPCEPRLEAAGLPWFYFTTLDSLREEFHQKFLQEAAQHWGEAALAKPTPEETA
jgi:hypothetical protein